MIFGTLGRPQGPGDQSAHACDRSRATWVESRGDYLAPCLCKVRLTGVRTLCDLYLYFSLRFAQLHPPFARTHHDGPARSSRLNTIMGFFKRILSLGSKKSKRKARHDTNKVDASGRIVQALEPWPQADKEATRLLRTSSAHLSVVSEVDYSSLPPLREPLVAFRVSFGTNAWRNRSSSDKYCC